MDPNGHLHLKTHYLLLFPIFHSIAEADVKHDFHTREECLPQQRDRDFITLFIEVCNVLLRYL